METYTNGALSNTSANNYVVSIKTSMKRGWKLGLIARQVARNRCDSVVYVSIKTSMKRGWKLSWALFAASRSAAVLGFNQNLNEKRMETPR
jgi:hypothetical protein